MTPKCLTLQKRAEAQQSLATLHRAAALQAVHHATFSGQAKQASHQNRDQAALTHARGQSTASRPKEMRASKNCAEPAEVAKTPAQATYPGSKQLQQQKCPKPAAAVLEEHSCHKLMCSIAQHSQRLLCSTQ